ncbi:MAG TPA: hypothetical protein PKY31_01645 [Spirochaetota bacterium]|nr:hypothetical protein [Spirochaetota bacterium]
MQLFNRIVCVFWFFAFALFFGNMYSRINLSYNAALIITVALSVLLAAGMILELILKRRE